MGQFDLVIGVLLIGLFFNTYLYGLVTYQFIVYHNTKFNDRLWIRAVVGFLFVLDTLHSAVAVYAGWEACVTNYDNPASLAFISWTIPFTALATSLAAFVTQMFLGHRVFILTKSTPLVAFIGILSLLGLVFGFYAGIYSGILHAVAKFGPLGPYVTCWLVFQTAADLIITVSLSFVLSRSRTGFRRTDTIINRIIRGAVQTGLFVSLFALGDMFSFLLHRDTNLYAMFAYPMGRIYTNTLLDTLNARTALKSQSNTQVESDTFRMQNQTHTAAGHTVHSIHVQKEVITDLSEASIHADTKYPVSDV
ncbi:hypothetical protein GALMADRAFT_133037 [Galerina marginata CBS 339.88]|uniref:DUF6534 domain-containing protein n=1 Tax=Galerina marginata (strain CBS 339.88) TaxID=685588 RepID=A0A067TX58_GALM3|nr:hypothetical protein GALMADRAFT_133037 [Galerina marginata CBS 339.88]